MLRLIGSLFGNCSSDLRLLFEASVSIAVALEMDDNLFTYSLLLTDMKSTHTNESLTSSCHCAEVIFVFFGRRIASVKVGDVSGTVPSNIRSKSV